MLGDIYETQHACNSDEIADSDSDSPFPISAFSDRPLPRCPKCMSNDKLVVKMHPTPLGYPKDPANLVIKVTRGLFSTTYHDNSLLHVGLTGTVPASRAPVAALNAESVSLIVFNFDERGVHADTGGPDPDPAGSRSSGSGSWSECLSVPVGGLGSVDSDGDGVIGPEWSVRLLEFAQMWAADDGHRIYHPLHNNCFSFCVAAINYITQRTVTVPELAENVVRRALNEFERHRATWEVIRSSGAGFVLGKEVQTQVQLGSSTSASSVNVNVHICDGRGCGARMTCYWKCVVCADFDLCDRCYQEQGHEHEMNVV